MRALPRLTGHLCVLSGTLLFAASSAWARNTSPDSPRAILTDVRPYVSNLALGTTDPNAWVSEARCPVSGAALRTTFVTVDLFIFVSRSS